MNRLKEGQIAPQLHTVQSIGGTVGLSQTMCTLVSFFRFSTCPYCNMRVRFLQHWHESNKDIALVGVFGSPAADVTQVKEIHGTDFPLAADTAGDLYRLWRIQKSFSGMLKGMIFRFPTLVRGLLHGYIPKNPHGHLMTMPAQFLVSPAGTLLLVHYGRDEGDHVDLQRIRETVDSRKERQKE
ncbi:MAG: redoxin domain-containing protein [Fibrobacterota bacterium]